MQYDTSFRLNRAKELIRGLTDWDSISRRVQIWGKTEVS